MYKLINNGLESQIVDGSIDGKLPLIHFAIFLDQFHLVELLLSYFRNYIDFPENLFKLTPLHLAVILGRTEIVNLLLKYGANYNSVDNFYQTPLHYAVKFNNIHIIRLLKSNLK